MPSVEHVEVAASGPLAAAGYWDLRNAIRRSARVPEHEGVRQLLDMWRADDGLFEAARERAAGWVRQMRETGAAASGVASLMQEFSLSSQEGIALMCLAEALARIPDRDTAYALILDKLDGRDWAAHLGRKRPIFVHAAVWGLFLTGRLASTHPNAELGGALTSALKRGGRAALVAAVTFAVQLLGEQFVLGQSIDDALARGAAAARRGYRHSFDMLGEAALSAADAQGYLLAYQNAIERIGAAYPCDCGADLDLLERPGISVKLSALHPRFAWSQGPRVRRELYPRLLDLCHRAAAAGLGLTIDAEEADRLEPTLDLLARLAFEPSLRAWNGLGLAVQAYQKRAVHVIEALTALARASAKPLMVRLVKGAYWDAEIKYAQTQGLPDFPVWTRKAHTDLAYLVCAQRLFDAGGDLVPQFASHNALTVSLVEAMARRAGISRYEFQCLHGMGEALYELRHQTSDVAALACRIYAPVGTHETLLPYLVRRLLENGANVSFVHRLHDPSVSDDALLADPVRASQRNEGAPHALLRHPLELFEPHRGNSQGVDLTDRSEVLRLRLALRRLDAQAPLASARGAALPAAGAATRAGGRAIRAETRVSPSDRRRVIGRCCWADAATVEQALRSAAASDWYRAPAFVRAELLDRSAQALEAQREHLVALLVREAGKCFPDAIAEVREAVDFCRYYAMLLRDAKPWDEADDRGWQGLGLTVAISPWNFPLAIFVGQIMAALAAGCAVVAKPAEQTPLIACAVADLLYAAGIPVHALAVLPGDGLVGEALVRDDRVRAVLFTGSNAVACRIDTVLAERFERGDCALVAETGGQNAMIVDASALPEQVVQDAVHSAFNSAGQRCSALRVLCVQEEIAPRVTELLIGAMRELRCGEPARLDTDLGPLIDTTARERVEQAVAAAGDRLLARGEPSAEAAHGHYAAPALITIDHLDELGDEIFGPVLHLLRYRGDALDALIDDINRTGYGLTCGVHSRIDEHIARVADRIRAGNVYVNRTITGAVVGVQPFGGDGLSGTGPKAGGPWMLRRLRCRREGVDATPAPGRRTPGSPELDALFAWWRARGQQARVARCLAWMLDPVVTPIRLDGPSGERNTLRYRPRPRIACVARALPGELESARREAVLEQIVAGLAVGASLVIDIPDRDWLRDDLPAGLQASLQPADLSDLARAVPAASETFDVVLYRGPRDAAPGVRRQLAQRTGARTALIIRDDAAVYPLWRLYAEQCLSINTAAAGGNAELINLGE